jgi:hypothetical protein
MQGTPPLKEQLMLINALAVSHDEHMGKLIQASRTAKRFTDALRALGKSPEFYTLLFSVHDKEIPLSVRSTLGTQLQHALYSNCLKEFITSLYNYLAHAADDYETGYYLIILESTKEFMATSFYQEFSNAKIAFDNDHCTANEQLKESIALLKQQVRELMNPSNHNLSY